MHTFVRSDLSSYNREKSQDFYKKVFGRDYFDSGDGDYHIATGGPTKNDGSEQITALFTTPEFLQKLNMPSFWMSYISVENVEETIEKAKRHPGAIIEMGPLPGFYDGSRVALIRDPSGAGFTVVDGYDTTTYRKTLHGHICRNALYLKDIKEVSSFYEDLFSWSLQPQAAHRDRYDIIHQGTCIANIQEIPDELRGPKRRRSITFASDNMMQTKQRILDAGGEIYNEWHSHQGTHLAAYDSEGATFMVIGT